jgi:hypothetical protein
MMRRPKQPLPGETPAPSTSDTPQILMLPNYSFSLAEHLKVCGSVGLR